MSHSLLDAERLTLAEVAQSLDVHISTVWRWIQRGAHGHVLPAVRIGHRRYVLTDELERWLAAQQDAGGQQQRGETSQSAGRRAEAAEAELDDIGI